ncbi:hypothetical protein CALCODRAFT_82865 [Calocera cornea HHB12733]|uniref:Ribosomal RNA large subunit methyltransferase K/L-like methyltransferase domain-containing protein n=1 Tax=Calocera cornea HHB12733 TaxID=1353952 RepID=A0A165DDH0_9BASI|nr:hypothetical protein CALCODRAFT_82865 [Calocera cornea HHB12733]
MHTTTSTPMPPDAPSAPPNLLTLAFHVPTGLEDYALCSLLAQLAHRPPASHTADRAHQPMRLQYAAPPASAHVLLRFPTPDLLQRAADLYARGELWAAWGAFVCLQEWAGDGGDPEDLGPQGAADGREAADEEQTERVRQLLEREWKDLQRAVGGRARGWKAQALEPAEHAAIQQQQQQQQVAAEVPPHAVDDPAHAAHAEPRTPTPTPTPGEALLLLTLQHLVTSHFAALARALELLHLPGGAQAQAQARPTFRATFANPSRLLPLSTLHTRDVETQLGEALTLSPCVTRAWRVQLVDPALDVHVRVLPSRLHWHTHTLGAAPPAPPLPASARAIPAFPPALTLLLAVALPAPAPAAHRLPQLVGPTPLAPPIAHLLALIYLLAAPPGASPLALDPFSGLGSIPRELLALARQRQHPLHVLAGDISLPSLLLSQQNTPRILSALQYSALHALPLRGPALGGWLSDLPWGTRHLSPRQLSALYPAVLRRLAAVVGAGGAGVAMSAARRTMDGALRGARRWWATEACWEARVGGRAVWVWLLRRTLEP